MLEIVRAKIGKYAYRFNHIKRVLVPDPHDLVTCYDGCHFGIIDDPVAVTIARAPGPVCLPYGIPGPTGFGLSHVEGMPTRIERLRSFGFATFVTYAHFVCRRYDWIARGEKERLVLVRQKDFYDLNVVIQFETLKGYWAITTGVPKRVERRTKLWERVQVGRSEPSPSGVENRSRRETLTLPRKR